MPNVAKIALPVITVEPNSDLTIQSGVLNGKFKVDMLYKETPDDANIVIVMNGDYENPKIFKESVKTFPDVETITDADLRGLFNLTSIESGNKFEIGLDVKIGNTWYPAFNSSGYNYTSSVINLPGSAPILTYNAVCKLVLDDFVGTATVTTDEWWGETPYNVNITKSSDTELTVTGLCNGACSNNLVIKINKADYTVTIDKQVLEPGSGYWWGAAYVPAYNNFSLEGSGTIDACNNSISFTAEATVDAGSFGNVSFKIEK